MQLTPLQLQIQKLGADKELKFGCLVKSKEYMRFLRIDEGEFMGDVATCLTSLDTICGVMGFRSDADFVIGKPVDYGRLCFLLCNDTVHNTREGDIKKWLKISQYMDIHRDTYQQNTLDRPEELQVLVLDYLQTLPVAQVE